MKLRYHPFREEGIPGYVYLFKCKDLYKIGFTTQDVEQRRKSVQLGRKDKVLLVDCFWTEDPAREEAEIHWTMREYRVYGEWFKIPHEMVESDYQRNLWFSSDEKGFVNSDYFQTSPSQS